MKRILTMIVLLLALAGTASSTLMLNGRVSAMRRENEARVTAAQNELDAQKAAYAAIDPSTDEGMARQIEAERQAVAEAQVRRRHRRTVLLSRSQQTDDFRQKNEALRRDIETLTGQIRELEADEENTYYLAVYESLHRGMETVEDCLDGE